MGQSSWKKIFDRLSGPMRPLRGELLESRCLLSSAPVLLTADAATEAELLDAGTLPLVAPPRPAEPVSIETTSDQATSTSDIVEAPEPTGLPGDAAAENEAVETAASRTAPAAGTESIPEEPSSLGVSAASAAASHAGLPPPADGASRQAGDSLAADSAAKASPSTTAESTGTSASDSASAKSGSQTTAGAEQRSIAARAANLASSRDAAPGGAERVDPAQVVASAAEHSGAPAEPSLQPQLSGQAVATPQRLFSSHALEDGAADRRLGESHRDLGRSVWLRSDDAAATQSTHADLLTAVTDWWGLERLSAVIARFSEGEESVPTIDPAEAESMVFFAEPRASAMAMGSIGAMGRPSEPPAPQAANRRTKLRDRVGHHAAHDEALAALEDGDRLAGMIRPVEEDLIAAQLASCSAEPSPGEKLEAELAHIRDQLSRQERLAMVGQIAAGIAHDLRNPLAVVRSAAWLLKRHLSADDAKPRSYVDAIDAEVETANRIISNMMEMVRAKDAAKQPVDLGLATRQVFEKLQNRAEVECQIDCQPDPFTVDADPVQLRQVLGNLMSNGIEAMGGRGTLRVEARREGEFDVLQVGDTGPGVPLEIRDTLFEPLISTRLKGTGLGLAICRQIVERHGGTIDLLPTDSGAAFQIRLPRSPEPLLAASR